MKTTYRILTCLLLSLFALSAAGEEPRDAGVTFTQAELDRMLAPIALYPDTVLSHILIASTYPLEVVQAERWASRNKNLSGQEALEAVEGEDWDPSVKALAPFPNLLEQMADDLEWLEDLGEAFLQDEERVLDTVQQLRQRAYEEGSLKDMEHVEVTRDDDHIIIEPRVREVVYVPYYDTRVVYGPWWWDAYPPIYWPYRGYHYSSAAFVWGPRVYIGTGIYFSSFHWHRRHVVVVDHHHHHHFRSSRHVARYHGAHRWEHNPVHRRGVVYRSVRARERYGDPHRYSGNVNSGAGNVNSGNRGVINRSLSERDRQAGHPAQSANRREEVLRDLRNRDTEPADRIGTDRPRDLERRSVDNASERSGAVSEAMRRREAREAAGVRSEATVRERREYDTPKREYRAPETSVQPQRENRGAAEESVRERRQVERPAYRENRSTDRYRSSDRPSRSADRPARSRENNPRGGAISRSVRER